MKNNTEVREIHGARVTKIQSLPEQYGLTVTITDDVGLIVLSVGGATYPAGLTPAEARYLAGHLMDAADRLAETGNTDSQAEP